MPSRPRLTGGDRGRRVEPFLDDLEQRIGHVGLDLEPDDAPAPPALDRGAEVTDQVLGFLLDLDVAVAKHPETRRREPRRSAGTR